MSDREGGREEEEQLEEHIVSCPMMGLRCLSTRCPDMCRGRGGRARGRERGREGGGGRRWIRMGTRRRRRIGRDNGREDNDLMPCRRRTRLCMGEEEGEGEEEEEGGEEEGEEEEEAGAGLIEAHHEEVE